MSRTKRYRERIVDFLESEVEANTYRIYDYLKDNWTWSPTMPALGNILGKFPEFTSPRIEYTRDHFSTNRRCQVWALSED